MRKQHSATTVIFGTIGFSLVIILSIVVANLISDEVRLYRVRQAIKGVFEESEKLPANVSSRDRETAIRFAQKTLASQNCGGIVGTPIVTTDGHSFFVEGTTTHKSRRTSFFCRYTVMNEGEQRLWRLDSLQLGTEWIKR